MKNQDYALSLDWSESEAENEKTCCRCPGPTGLPVRGDHAAAKGLRGYRVKLELPVQKAQQAFRVQWVSQVQQVQPEKWGLAACRA